MSGSCCQRHEPELFFTITLDEKERPRSATYGFMVDGRPQQMCPFKNVRGLTRKQVCSLSPQKLRELPDHLN